MKKEELLHYHKGGVFKAIYDPPKKDVSPGLQSLFDGKVEIFANYDDGPIIDVPTYKGQRKWFIEGMEYAGWCPTEDFRDIKMVDRVVDTQSWKSYHNYRMTYTTREQVIGNFGISGKEMSLPFTTGRNYSEPKDDYIRKLSTPPADKIEYAVYDPSDPTKELEWVEI